MFQDTHREETGHEGNPCQLVSLKEGDEGGRGGKEMVGTSMIRTSMGTITEFARN